MDFTVGTAIVITPCLLGFDVKTYGVRIYNDGTFIQGQGFIRPLGIFSASALVRQLAATPDPVIVHLK